MACETAVCNTVWKSDGTLMPTLDLNPSLHIAKTVATVSSIKSHLWAKSKRGRGHSFPFHRSIPSNKDTLLHKLHDAMDA